MTRVQHERWLQIRGRGDSLCPGGRLESPGLTCKWDPWRNHSASLCLSLLICQPGIAELSLKVIVTNRYQERSAQHKVWHALSTQISMQGASEQGMEKEVVSKLENRTERQELQRGENRVSFSSHPCSLSLCLGPRMPRRAVCGRTQNWKGGFSGLMGTLGRKGMQCFPKLLSQIG